MVYDFKSAFYAEQRGWSLRSLSQFGAHLVIATENGCFKQAWFPPAPSRSRADPATPSACRTASATDRPETGGVVVWRASDTAAPRRPNSRSGFPAWCRKCRGVRMAGDRPPAAVADRLGHRAAEGVVASIWRGKPGLRACAQQHLTTPNGPFAGFCANTGGQPGSAP